MKYGHYFNLMKASTSDVVITIKASGNDIVVYSDNDSYTFTDGKTPFTTDQTKYKMIGFSFNQGGSTVADVNACFFTYEEGGTSKGGCIDTLAMDNYLVDLNTTTGFYYNLIVGRHIDG
jgi:hypothetical protein